MPAGDRRTRLALNDEGTCVQFLGRIPDHTRARCYQRAANVPRCAQCNGEEDSHRSHRVADGAIAENPSHRSRQVRERRAAVVAKQRRRTEGIEIVATGPYHHNQRSASNWLIVAPPAAPLSNALIIRYRQARSSFRFAAMNRLVWLHSIVNAPAAIGRKTRQTPGSASRPGLAVAIAPYFETVSRW